MTQNMSLALQLLPSALLQTLYMVLSSTFLALVCGFPLGFLLFYCQRSSLRPLYKVLSLCINIGRSFPFAILMIALIPVTKWIIGTSLGTSAAIVPLSIAAVPFLARLVESAFEEVDPTLLATMQLMGASQRQLLIHVLLTEPLPALIRTITLTSINLVGYSAMAGLIGGGGLGQIALQYGYQRFNTFLLGGSVLLLILIVEGIQFIGNKIAKDLLKKRGI